METSKPTTLNALKHERVVYLKEMKRLANKLLAENKATSGYKAKWEKEVIENNILQLKKIIQQLNNDRSAANVEKYAEMKSAMLTAFPDTETIEHYMSITVQKIKEEGFKLELSRFSVNYSLINDLYWIHDGMMGDHLDIALGRKPPETLEIYCEEKLRQIQEQIIPFTSNHPVYSSATPMLQEIVQNFGQNSYLTTNILMAVVIENVIRNLATWLWSKQNPTVNFNDAADHVAKLQSLEKLITYSGWKDDIPMDFYTAALESKYIPDDKLAWVSQILEKWDAAKIEIQQVAAQLTAILEDNGLSGDSKQAEALKLTERVKTLLSPFDGVDKAPVFVSLKVKLQFLIRRFKDDRNAILHGHFNDLNKKWKCYVNFSALINSYKLIIDLEKLYQ